MYAIISHNINLELEKRLQFIKKHSIDFMVLLAILLQWMLAGHLLAYSAEQNAPTNLPAETQAIYMDPFEVLSRKKLVITAYSSTPDQTDFSPCITANGFDLCAHNEENIIAANFLRFGTKVRIPAFSQDKIYIVQDRMNARYPYRLDLWMKERENAKIFGAKYLEIEVLK